MAVTKRTLDNMERAIAVMRGAHDFHDPGHGNAILLHVRGLVDAMLKRREDDPQTLAVILDDYMPTIKGHLRDLEKWARFYSNVGPDDTASEGGNKCL